MSSATKRIAGDNFIFLSAGQRTAPAHRARNTEQLLQRETLNFLSS